MASLMVRYDLQITRHIAASQIMHLTSSQLVCAPRRGSCVYVLLVLARVEKGETFTCFSKDVAQGVKLKVGDEVCSIRA
jgi:hypothetical protein